MRADQLFAIDTEGGPRNGRPLTVAVVKYDEATATIKDVYFKRGKLKALESRV